MADNLISGINKYNIIALNCFLSKGRELQLIFLQNMYHMIVH